MSESMRQGRTRIETVLGDGGNLEDVERDVLAGSPLPEELRDALWLYAWSRAEQDGAGHGQRTVLAELS